MRREGPSACGSPPWPSRVGRPAQRIAGSGGPHWLRFHFSNSRHRSSSTGHRGSVGESSKPDDTKIGLMCSFMVRKMMKLEGIEHSVRTVIQSTCGYPFTHVVGCWAGLSQFGRIGSISTHNCRFCYIRLVLYLFCAALSSRDARLGPSIWPKPARLAQLGRLT